MQKRSDRRSSSTSSFAKALLFLVVLVVAWFIADRVGRKGIPGPFSEMLNSEQAPSGGYIPLDTASQNRVVEAAAGFWRASLHDSLSDHLFTGTDMIELKDNGIVWRVLDYRLFVPGGDTLVYRKVYDAYLRPHGWERGKDSVAACDVRILRQAAIAGPDTCYGPTDVDVVWSLGIGVGFALEGRNYAAYSGDLGEFFPQGAIDMLERAYQGGGPGGARSAYQVQDGQIRLVKPLGDKDALVTMELPECDSALSFVSFARSELSRKLGSLDSTIWHTVSLDSLASSTYGTLLRWDLSNGTVRDALVLPAELDIDLSVAPDGAIEKIMIDAEVSRRVRSTASKHAGDWRLPPWAEEVAGNGSDVSIRLK